MRLRAALLILSGAVVGCAVFPPPEDWQGTRLSRAACREADSIFATGPDTAYMYAWALGSQTECHRDGWVRLAQVWHDNRTSTDSIFLIILAQASRGPIERPTLDTMLTITRSPSASTHAREAAFRELMHWRIPGVFVHDSAISPWPGGPGCHTVYITDVLLDPPPSGVAARMDRMLVQLTADASYPHLRRLSLCYLEHLSYGEDVTAEVRGWAATRSPR